MKKFIIPLFFTLAVLTFFSCGGEKEEEKESLTKRTAKFLAKKSMEAADGVSEALKEDGEETAESLAEATGELVSGAARGLSDVADEKGNEIGRNLGNATAKTLTGYVRSLEDNLVDTELSIPSSSSEDAVVLSVTKMIFQADSINAYICFKTKGTYDLILRLKNENNEIVGEAYETVQIDRAKPTYQSVNFGYGNSEPIRKAKLMELEVNKK